MEIGADTGTRVSDAGWRTPFEFTGTLTKLTIALDRPKLTPADEKLLRQENQRSNRASE